MKIAQPGAFVIGCNYWASHAGTRMWSDWQPDVVAEDLRQLAEGGLQILRVFPLWPDFQPLNYLYTGAGRIQELRMGETPLDNDAAGKAGISTVMIERFAHFADMAQENGLKLFVGLITGWMSGRLFVPPAFEGCNVLTDPVVIKWQTRFVRYFVKHFKDHPAIAGWDLGNECNCMAPIPSQEAAWAWTSAIVNAIRVEDKSRPLVSGMHSLGSSDKAEWRIQDQGELTDLLTTHPYPIFTPHCDHDPVNTIRNGLHATAESRMYADIGDTPCIAEELGTLGPMISSESIAADYVRTALFSLWAHDCQGLLWWCGFDQDHLTHAPYDWHSHERELGLYRKDRTPKPVLLQMGEFGHTLQTMPFDALPQRQQEAVCILTADQDQWAAAFGAFILAKQAGFDLSFQYADQPLKPAGLYLLPSLVGGQSYTRRFWLELDAAVKDGATLYLSHDTCMLSPFNEPFGLEVQTRSRRSDVVRFTFEDQTFEMPAPIKLTLKVTTAEVIGAESDANPVLTHAAYGEGAMVFLSVPIERYVSETSGVFHLPDAQPFWQIYRWLAESFLGDRVLRKQSPFLGVTEHPVDDTQRYAVLINYSPDVLVDTLSMASAWQLGEVLYGQTPTVVSDGLRVRIPPNDAVVITFTK